MRTPNRKGRIPRAFRRLEFGLLMVMTVFFGQLFLVSRRLPETEPHPPGGPKNPTKLFYAKAGYKVEGGKELIANVAAMASRLKEAGAIDVDKASASSDKEQQQKRKEGETNSPAEKLETSGATKSVEKNSKKKRRRRRKRKNWDPGEGLKSEPVPLKITFPVFVPSLPKSGTTSIWQYFNCGGHHASHQWVKVNDTESMQSGQCMKQNIALGQPPFQDCGNYDVFTDTGYALYQASGPNCYYPSVEALEEIYQAYPNATFVMVVRNTASWFTSVEKWGEGSLLKRWGACNTTGYGWTTKREKVEAFYDWHTENIRQFAMDHPSLNYIEVGLESEDTGKLLEDKIGIPATCWGKCTPYSKFCKK